MCNKETTNVNRHTSKCELQNCNICKRYKHFVYKGFKDKQNMIDYMRKKSSVHVAGSCNYCPKCGKPLTDQVLKEQKTQTNADKIRSMTDEELARSMDMVCPPDTACNDGQQCIKCWIDWLKQPVK